MVREGFDAIVGVNTFSYYPNKKTALRNYAKLLRDDGRLVFLDIHGQAYSQQIAYITNFRGAKQFAENIRESTRPVLSALLSECGFRVERIERKDFELKMETKAESDPVVAAASIIARAEFLRQLRKLSTGFGEELLKGAGAATKAQGSKLVEQLGPDRLREFAKMHFRTSYEILGLPVPQKTQWVKR